MTQFITQQQDKDVCKETLEQFHEDLKSTDLAAKECPECIPNQNYIEPNILYSEESYYNEKICRYIIDFSGEHSVSYVAQNYG